jgi:hypothetical protein
MKKTSLAGLVSSKSNFGKDSTAKPAKPEIDLESWSKLGGIGKGAFQPALAA